MFVSTYAHRCSGNIRMMYNKGGTEDRDHCIYHVAMVMSFDNQPAHALYLHVALHHDNMH